MDADLPYEEDLVRNAYEPRAWLRYLEHKRSSSGDPGAVYFTYERAVGALPGSYKLWKAYLDERVTGCLQMLSLAGGGAGAQAECEAVRGVFERCLLYLGAMPRIWLDYAAFLLRQRKITETRHVLNRALQSLPVGQHQRVWEVALRFARGVEPRSPRTALLLWRRFWQTAARPAHHQEYYEVLLRLRRYDDAAVLLQSLAQAEQAHFGAAVEGADEAATTPEAFWERLCQLVMAHGEKITAVDPEQILRTAIRQATAASAYAALQGGAIQRVGPRTRATGVFWAALAMLRIRRRDFAGARAVYEEALLAVPTVRDFAIVFDAAAKFEETLLAAELEKRRRAPQGGSAGAGSDGAYLGIDTGLARLEQLLERRAVLLQEIRLRQQPNSVAEWARLLDLHAHDDQLLVATFERALTTIHAKRARGDLPGLWQRFAALFEELHAATGDPAALESAEDIYEKAVAAELGSADHEAQMWIHYAEYTRRHTPGLDAAIALLGRPTAPAAGRVHRSARLWGYLADLEEARGAPAAVRAVYERILQLGLATVQTVVNYAAFLEASSLDDAFRAYERGIALFGYPLAFDLWNIYLPKAVDRWAATRLERVRDLFEQALAGCPPKHLKALYLMQVAVEEQHGLAGRAALRVLARACAAVPAADRLELYRLLLQKTVALEGIVAARPVYEAALSTAALDTHTLTSLAAEYAALETKLGEVDRARAIYAHAGGLGDPRLSPALWQAWADFEVAHGSEETFREMLRVKRSAAAKYMIAPTAFVRGEDDVRGDDGVRGDDTVHEEDTVRGKDETDEACGHKESDEARETAAKDETDEIALDM